MAAVGRRGSQAGAGSSWNHFHKAVIEAGEEEPGKIVSSARVLTSIFGADSGTRFGNTVLHFACALRPPRPKLIRMLLKKGAAPSQPNDLGETALHYAAIHCSEAVVGSLLASPLCDLNARDDLGSTALHWAADQGEDHALAVTELLLNTGADAGIKDKHGDTALHYAAKAGSYDVFRALERRLDKCRIYNKRGYAPLHCACLASQEQFIQRYLADHPGHETLVTRDDEETPLLLAVRARSGSSVMALTSSPEGRDAVNADDAFGRTPHFLATTLDDHFMMALLTERGARGDMVVALDMLRNCSYSSSSSDLSSMRSYGSLPPLSGTDSGRLEAESEEDLRLHIVAQSPRKMALDDVTTPGRGLNNR